MEEEFSTICAIEFLGCFGLQQHLKPKTIAATMRRAPTDAPTAIAMIDFLKRG